MICLDVSNWDQPTFDAAGFREAGVDRLIVGCQWPEIARGQIAAAQAVGIRVIGVYVYLEFEGSAVDTTQAGIDVAREYGVGTVWIDVEDKDGTVEGRIAATEACVALVEAAGLRPGIYTGGWYWGPFMGNTDRFAHLPLWHSAYWDDGREVRTVSYGGWSQVAVHQYTSSLPVCGRNRDANYVFEEGETDMTPEQVRAIVDEAVGQAFLPLLKQAVGVDPSTFSDYAGVEAIRQKVALPPGFDPVRAMQGADQAYALNDVLTRVWAPQIQQALAQLGVPVQLV